ncbi:MAG TPA: toxin-antitoxin system protein [Phycisphaerae bacterium]|nr:toxin-antitoxin system protein [Phycisphaerae bacterium]
MAQTLRINPQTRQKLQRIARAESLPMTRMLDKIVEAYDRRRLLEDTNAAFARLQKNSRQWRQELKERAQWDATLGDGLEGD